MGRTGVFLSIIAIAAGAVMYWGVTTTQTHGFRLSTVGVILMAAGAVGFVASAWAFGLSRRPNGSHSVICSCPSDQGALWKEEHSYGR